MKGQEVSLHASGKQHISIDPNSRSTANLTKKQFMNQWYQPDEGTATLRLVFPPWGIQLDEEQRDKFRSTWNENDIFIEGHHEFLTVVSFYIVNERARYQRKDKFPGFLLGELPLKIGKKLAITAEWQAERGFRVNIENALRQSPPEKNLMEDHLVLRSKNKLTYRIGPFMMRAMARHAPSITLDPEERAALESIVRSPISAQRDAKRARIVLLAATGHRNDQIQQALGVSKPVVVKWRQRFARSRLDGLCDESGRGRKRKHDAVVRHRIAATACDTPPRRR